MQEYSRYYPKQSSLVYDLLWPHFSDPPEDLNIPESYLVSTMLS